MKRGLLVGREALRLVVAVVAFLSVLFFVSEAHAKVVRYSVLVGNNRGEGSDAELKHAEAETGRLYEVLKDVGGFIPANSVVLRGESPDTLRATLISMNDRIRTTTAPGDEAMLFVYYSGHADAGALHMNGKRFDVAELESLVRGSSSTFRLLVLDACRSGAITRTKGGRTVAPFSISLDDHLAGQGMVFLSSAAANEDAQESDELGGSFFTHALISGLVGAADSNGDGLVVLEEAYRYAYETTLRATTSTMAGAQHPSFRFDLRGQGNVVLTDLARHSNERATLVFPPGRAYLVLASARDGNVVAEVNANDAGRRLYLKPGRYFVRGRTAKYLLEGEIRTASGQEVDVKDEMLTRVEYARLVRKGGSDKGIAHGPSAGFRVRSPLDNESSPGFGAYAGYALHFREVTLEPRLAFARSSFENARIEASVQELSLALRASRSWDTSIVTFDLGVSAGGGWLHQSFTTRGLAPDRDTFAGIATVFGGLTRALGSGFEISAGVEGAMVVFRLEDAEGAESLRASPAIIGNFGLAKLF